MRGRRWLGVGAGAVLAAALSCRDRVPPQTPPPPRTEDISNMPRAGFPAAQGIPPSGESGEGPGFPGEQSAVKELPVQKPTNVGTPGGRSPEQPAQPQK